VAALLNNILLARFFLAQICSLQLGSPLNCERGTGPIFWPKCCSTTRFLKKMQLFFQKFPISYLRDPPISKKTRFLGVLQVKKPGFFTWGSPHWLGGQNTPHHPPTGGTPQSWGFLGTPKLGVGDPPLGTPQTGGGATPHWGVVGAPPKGMAASMVVGGGGGGATSAASP